jgi:hypothetical protein
MFNNNNNDFKEIFENARKDPTLFSTIDIESLLKTTENEKNEYLLNKTTDDIMKEIMVAIDEIEYPIELSRKQEFYAKLVGYRYIDFLYGLHKGKHIRWIRKNNGTMTNGGIVMDIKFTDNGTQVLVKNGVNRFIQIKMDECLLFQKMTVEEQIILMASTM